MDEKRFTCLNGRMVLAHRAAVSVADRGFRFGDGVFETIRIARSVPLYWDAHMDRLASGLRALRIELDIAVLEPHARTLLRKNEGVEGFLRITISRGAGSRGYAPYPPGMPPSWAIEWTAYPHATLPPATLYLSSIARIPPACLPTAAKLAQGLNSTLALMEARDHKADEALQLAMDGAIAEASSANIFWLKHGTLYTPTLETGCLAGVTREQVLRLSPFPTRIVREGLSTLNDAEAVFLTNSRAGVWPVAILAPSGQRFNTRHPIISQLEALLKQDHQKLILRERKRWIAA
jgi:branched-subunit amino acid aminotransferase/4-amino-4-deoxychorismate lyase